MITYQSGYAASSELAREAARVNHPDPAHATWGEVNLLSVQSLQAGRLPSCEEARKSLEWAERMSDFEDTMRGGS